MAEGMEGDAIAAASYVWVFADRDYAGPAAYLSVDYPNLGSIGWNDRISSYRVLVSGNGELCEHATYVG